MNEIATGQRAPWRPLGGAPERMRFTVEQFYWMNDAGLFADLGKVELLDGEIYVSPQYVPHARAQKRFYSALDRSVAASGQPGLETFFELTIDDQAGWAPQPDILVVQNPIGERGVAFDRVRLVVEVADTTVIRDAGVKRRGYAAAGVPEYWVVSIADEAIERFARPVEGDYLVRDRLTFAEGIHSITLPGVGVTADWLAG